MKQMLLRVDDFKPGSGKTGPYISVFTGDKKRNFFRNTTDKAHAVKQAENYDRFAKEVRKGSEYTATVSDSGQYENIVLMELVTMGQGSTSPRLNGPDPSRYNLIDLFAASKIAASVLGRDKEEVVSPDHILSWASDFVVKIRERAKEMEEKR